MNQKQRLIFLARELAVQGIALEATRKKLKDLVEVGVPYNSEEMLRAAEDGQKQQARWNALEKEYLRLRGELASPK